MISVRALSRAASSCLLRQKGLSFRSASILRPRFVTLAPSPFSLAPRTNFSTSISRREETSDLDQLLSAKLSHELDLEHQSRDSSELPESFQRFLEDSDFKLTDKSGSQFATLTKQFEDEEIKVEFSIGDINALQEDDPEDDDPAFGEEDFDPTMTDSSTGSRRNINQSTPGGKIDAAPEDSIAASDLTARGEEPPIDDVDPIAEDDTAALPLDIQITITKPTIPKSGALQIQARVADGQVEIEQLSYFPTAQLADASTTETVREASNLYAGPPFRSLDADVCDLVEQYLDERGIGEQLAFRLPDYVDHKEQKEYVQYLQNIKNFVDA